MDSLSKTPGFGQLIHSAKDQITAIWRTCASRAPTHLGDSVLEQREIRQIAPSDRSWIINLLRDHWGSANVIIRGRLYHADELPGLIAADQAENVGLLTYSINGTDCEIVTLNSVRESRGVGCALLRAVESIARQAGCTRLRLTTTNDNLKALRFYQKRGFVLVALHREAVLQSRKLKPEIPMVGIDGIPIRDEVELELPLRGLNRCGGA